MTNITVNAEPRLFAGPLTVAELIRSLGKDPSKLAVEVNRDVVPRAEHPSRQLRDGDAVEIVTLVGGGSPLEPPVDKPLKVGKFTFTSRLFTGTGKYASYELMQRCMAASGCEVTTVAVRRERLIDKEGKSLLDFLDLKKLTILPNTAGCFSADDAIRHARLARELLGNLGNPGADWVKLECLGDKKTLLPDPIDTLHATEQLVKEGFQVLVYTTDDPIMARRLKAGRGGERDAGRQPDRQRPGHPEPQQHPHHPGIPEGRRPGLSRDRGCRRRHGERRGAGDGTRLRRRAARTRRSPGRRTRTHGLGDALCLRRRPPGIPRRPHSPEALRQRQQPDGWYNRSIPVKELAMSAAEVLAPMQRLWDDSIDRDWEIVDGVRVEMPPKSVDSQVLASDFAYHLNTYGFGKDIGIACVNVLFNLPLNVDRSRRPDAAFISYARWAKNRPVPSTNAWNVLPDLFVEVVSPHDGPEEIETKVLEYLEAGVRLVWVVYPRHKSMYVYESPQKVRRLTRSDTLDGGVVLPGFQLPLIELFPDPPPE